MRIRSIKPEFWRSDDIAALTLSERLLFIGLWSYVDDNGVGSDKDVSIAADLFAPDLGVDPTETFRRVRADTASLESRGLIIRYMVDGKPLLYITNWKRHQMVKNPSLGHKYPLPPGESVLMLESLPTLSVDPPQTLGTGTGEQGNRGTGEQGNGGAEEQGKNPSPSDPADAEIRPEFLALLDLLDVRVVANGHRKPSRTKKNVKAVELMVTHDDRTVDQIRSAILWATNDEFWRGNIRSMSKLREKYSQLQVAAERSRSSSAKQPAYATNLDVVHQFEQQEHDEQDRSIEAADPRVSD